MDRMRGCVAGLGLVLLAACGTPSTDADLAAASPTPTAASTPIAVPSPASRTPSPEDLTRPAECSSDAYREAIKREIDGGYFPISEETCDGQWAAFDIDFGAGACPPEDNSCRGERMHRTFWRNEGGLWQVITYQGGGDCAEVWRVEPAFPEAICERP